SHPKKAVSPTFDQGLPLRMRVLYIATTHRTGAWLVEALATDSATEIHLEEATGSMAGMARLRDELFDAVLVSHQPGELDAMELIEGYRTGVADSPIIVLGMQSEQEMTALCYELGADAYVCVNTTTTRNLIWVVARAVQRHDLLRENMRLKQTHQRRLQQEHDEANRLLSQQRALIEDLEGLWRNDKNDLDKSAIAGRVGGIDVERGLFDGEGPGEDSSSISKAVCQAPNLPEELIDHYRELLRTYVIMGSGNLADELGRLGEMLTSAGVDAGETMQLHVHVLEELVHGLGARSTRHVMTRADLLVLEIMIHLAEGYRQRYQERRFPEEQRWLPGFEDFLPKAG
ncbi:MAG: hypothetical protein U9N87_00445, partial [Planctomycetota bacterium]|nr:hypothetical protein [Planctomycetota bacterium]